MTAAKHKIAAGRYLRRHRRLCELTQSEIGEQTGFSRSFICSIETGKMRLPPNGWYRMARYLNVNPDIFCRKMLAYYEPDIFYCLYGCAPALHDLDWRVS